jgi:hypothetical protein
MAHQDELRAALTAGGIPTDDEKLALLADRLRLLGHLYRARCGERNAAGGLADHLKVIGNAIDKIERIIDGDGRIETTLEAFDEKAIEGLRALSAATRQAVLALSPGVNEKGRRQDIETSLFMELRNVYAFLSGKADPGNSERGPLYRFEFKCAKLIDPDLDFPKPASFRTRLMAALGRAHVPL